MQWGWRSHVTLGIFDSLTNKRFYGVRKENRLTVQFTNNPYTPYVVTGQTVVRDVGAHRVSESLEESFGLMFFRLFLLLMKRHLGPSRATVHALQAYSSFYSQQQQEDTTGHAKKAHTAKFLCNVLQKQNQNSVLLQVDVGKKLGERVGSCRLLRFASGVHSADLI